MAKNWKKFDFSIFTLKNRFEDEKNRKNKPWKIWKVTEKIVNFAKYKFLRKKFYYVTHFPNI